MSAQAHYFKIGLFVIAATVLLVIAIVVLGAGKLFQQSLYLETYINESVQGMDIGTPVKFRGVPIGSVKDIDFVFNIYDEARASAQEQRLIYILMQVKPKVFGTRRSESVEAFLAREVNKGLRVKLAPQGLTGQFYLELDYMNPAQSPPLAINWNPEYHHIPSSKGTIAFFTDSISEVFDRLKRFNAEGLLAETTHTLRAVQEAVAQANVAEVSQEMRRAMRSVQRATEGLNEFFARTDLTRLTSETQQFVVTARRVLEDNEGAVRGALEQLDRTLQSVSNVAARFDEYLGSDEGKRDFENLRAAVGSLSAATQNLAATFDRTMGRADRMMETHQYDLEIILENLRQITENLNSLTDRARSNPSGIIFSDPPPRIRTVP